MNFHYFFKRVKLHGCNMLGLRSTVQFSWYGRSRPAWIAGIYDGPMREIHHVDCAELEPVNQNTQTSIMWRHVSCGVEKVWPFCHLKAGLMPMLSGCGRAGVRLLRLEDGGGKSFWYWDCICSVSRSAVTAVDCIWLWFSSSSPCSLFPTPLCPVTVGWDWQGSWCEDQVTSIPEQ